MTCESCGADVAAVQAVRRKYVTAGALDHQPTERVLADVEHWCIACLTHYPHEPA
jgi:hypothetical protein